MENFESRADDYKVESLDKTSERLDKMANDPDIKNATAKISAKCLESNAMNKLLTSTEMLKDKKVSDYIHEVLRVNPELRLFISANLWVDKLMDKKYNQLTPDEKIKLLALHDTLQNKVYQAFEPYRDDQGKIDMNKFKKAYGDHMKGMIKSLSTDFKLAQLSNLGDIKKTLKEEYKLTEKESTKFIVYLEELKKQPKSSNVKEAGSWYFIVAGVSLILGIVLWVIGANYYFDFTHPAPPETVIQTGRVTISWPKEIARLGTVEADFKTAGVVKKEQRKVKDTDGWLKQQAKKLWNAAQSQEIIMELNGKFMVQFDLDNSTFEYDYGTKKIYAHLKKPKIAITEANPKIIKKNSEIFEIKAFDNTQMELLDSLKKDVVVKASEQSMLYVKAKESAEKILNAIYGDAFRITKTPFNWVEVITDVIEVPPVTPKN